MYDVITIGTVVRDVFLQSDAFKIVKDPDHLKEMGFPTGEAQCFALGGKVAVDNLVLSTGGGAVNTAVTFARLGLETGSLVKVGEDDNGKVALRELHNESVEPIVIEDTEHMTGYSVLLLGPSGERTVLTYRGASDELTEENIPFDKLQARWAYIVPARIPFEVMTALVSHLKKGGVRLAMDPSSHYLKMGVDKLRPLLEQLDVVKMNRQEASLLLGEEYEDEKGIFTTLDELIPGIAVMTDAARGVVISDGKHMYRAGIFQEEELVDRTGAGDAFGAGFVAALIGFGDNYTTPEALQEAIRLGTANATSVVEHVGAHAGALTRKAFENEERWQNLDITVEKL